MKTKALREAFAKEIEAAKEDMRIRHYQDAIRHLERAHVLGQMFFRPHVLVHFLLFCIAFETVDPVGMLGQLTRLVLGVIGGPLGLLPTGNVGSSEVSMFRRMPIPRDLAILLEGESHE